MFEDAKATWGKHMLMAPGLEANTVLFSLFCSTLNVALFWRDKPEPPGVLACFLIIDLSVITALFLSLRYDVCMTG